LSYRWAGLTERIVVHDMDGKEEPAELWMCRGCHGLRWIAYRIDGQDHAHLQCQQCGASYCVGEGSCAPVEAEGAANV